jgi:hypothetical protein
MKDVRSEAGFSLMEAIVATVISVIAIIGLAHTFGMGRGFIERFGIARTALSLVRGRMESFTASPDSIALGASYTQPFNYLGAEVGTIEWRVVPYDDLQIPGTRDLKNVVIVARWGPAGQRDSLEISRLFEP